MTSEATTNKATKDAAATANGYALLVDIKKNEEEATLIFTSLVTMLWKTCSSGSQSDHICPKSLEDPSNWKKDRNKKTTWKIEN